MGRKPLPEQTIEHLGRHDVSSPYLRCRDKELDALPILPGLSSQKADVLLRVILLECGQRKVANQRHQFVYQELVLGEKAYRLVDNEIDDRFRWSIEQYGNRH